MDLLQSVVATMSGTENPYPVRLAISKERQWLFLGPELPVLYHEKSRNLLDVTSCPIAEVRNNFLGNYTTTSCGWHYSTDHNQLVLGTWHEALKAMVMNDNKLQSMPWPEIKANEVQIHQFSLSTQGKEASLYGFSLGSSNQKLVKYSNSNGDMLSSILPDTAFTFSGTSHNPSDLWEILPHDIDSMLCFTSGLQIGKNFANDRSSKVSDWQATIADLEVLCGCDVNELAIEQVDIISLFSSQNNHFLAIRNGIISSGFEQLLQTLVGDFNQYKAYPILQSELGPLYTKLLGVNLTEELQVFTVVGNYLVFAENQEALSDYINKVASERVFRSSTELLTYTQSVQSNPELLAYWKSPPLLTGISRAVFAERAEALMLQITRLSGGVAQEMFSHSKKITAGQPLLNWEYFADQIVNNRPWSIRNHRSGGRDILIQDKNNTLYQLNSAGGLNWKRDLPSSIIGTPKQVDLYKNGKLQLIFSTQDAIYIFDRNGGSMDGFPIQLRSKASTEIKIFDYDSNRDYRFMIGLEDGSILNFNSSGRSQRGWAFKKAENAIVGLEHIRIQQKDYILALTKKGNIHLLKRNGKPRYEPKTRAEHYGGKGYYLLPGKSIGESKLIYPDSLGNVVVVQLDQPVNEFGLTGFSSGSILKFQDFDGDDQEDYVIVDDNELKIYNQDNQRLLRFEAPATITGEPSIYNFGGGERMVGFSTSQDEIYLIDKSGSIVSGFPKKGSSQYLISDLDRDGNFEAVVCTSYGSVINYHLGRMK